MEEENNVKGIIEKLDNDLDDKEKILNILRDLRKCVTAKQNPESASVIPKNYREKFTEKLFPFLQHDDELVRRLTWQVLHNSSVGNPEFLSYILEYCSKSNLILTKLQSEVPKTSNVICALIFQFVINVKEYDGEFVNKILSLDLIRMITKITREEKTEQCDFALLVLKQILNDWDDINCYLENLSAADRMTIFELTENIQENENLNEKLLKSLVVEFKKKSGSLFDLKNKDKIVVDPMESSKLLEIISKASSSDELRKVLQTDMSLLVDAIYVLKMMHDAGKNGVEDVKPVGKMEVLDAEVDTLSPIFGFKCNLIRLIGNLCDKHKENQDQVRDCSGIELLLDCSPMDAKNPMITQWVILAIHNLCENNIENQKRVSSIDKNGHLDKAKLSEIGIDIFNDK